MPEPAYLELHRRGELAARAAAAWEGLRACRGCAWECKMDRLDGRLGVCKTGAAARISSYGAHPGEERVLSGWAGSGTIFFAGCNLRCVYCQNAEISRPGAGREVSAAELAGMMLALQRRGCHNINLVSPSHIVAQILAALEIATTAGLCLPLVYNTGGYDSLESLRLLDGVVDIYMPDMKYASPAAARKYSKASNYPTVNQAAVREMHRQVGSLQIGADGLARRGLLVRHLVLPGGLAGTAQVARFLAEQISPDTYLNLMAQYHPARQAASYPSLNRRLSAAEFAAAVQQARQAGLTRLDARV